MPYRVAPGRGMMIGNRVYKGGEVLPVSFKPEAAHISGGDVVYSASESVKPTVAAPSLTVTTPEPVAVADAPKPEPVPESMAEEILETVESAVEGIDMNSADYLEKKAAWVTEKGTAKGFYFSYKAQMKK